MRNLVVASTLAVVVAAAAAETATGANEGHRESDSGDARVGFRDANLIFDVQQADPARRRSLTTPGPEQRQRPISPTSTRGGRSSRTRR